MFIRHHRIPIESRSQLNRLRASSTPYLIEFALNDTHLLYDCRKHYLPYQELSRINMMRTKLFFIRMIRVFAAFFSLTTFHPGDVFSMGKVCPKSHRAFHYPATHSGNQK